jgi:hypothetical protein
VSQNSGGLLNANPVIIISVSPDQGLAAKQMSGKKVNKFCITVSFACNADGSEKLPIFFIGKSKKPQCFGKGPNKRGFYYCNNKTAWMTAAYFEESVSYFSGRTETYLKIHRWIKQLDVYFKRQN